MRGCFGIIGVALVAGVLAADIRPAVAAEGPSGGRTLTVFAAASLSDAFTEIGAALEKRTPGLRVRFNFAGSQQLVAQLEQQASADVFASADERWMSRAVEVGKVEGEPRVFARNRLTVVVPRTNPARIGKLQDLARRGVKLVICAESVPAGRYARTALTHLQTAPGFPPEYAHRVLGNVVSEEENVRSVLGKVQLGEADAGIVYVSDFTPSAAKRARTLPIPDGYNVVAEYPIAALKSAQAPDAARAFIDLVLAAEGQAILERHGLMRVSQGAPSTKAP